MSSTAFITLGIISKFDASIWSVIAIASCFSTYALLTNSDGNNSPSLKRLWVCKSIRLLILKSPYFLMFKSYKF